LFVLWVSVADGCGVGKKVSPLSITLKEGLLAMKTVTTTRRSPLAALPAVLLAAFALAGCGQEPSQEPPAPPVEPNAPAALTYWGDVAPIYNAKCTRCHQDGGIAPFRLDRYDDARKHALKAAAATKAGIMPPYLMTHDGSCGQFQDDETLTEAEKSTIWQWANGEQKEGTRVALATPAADHLTDAQEWKTPTIVPVAEGGQLAEFDEYRCFPLDSNVSQDAFITGYEVLPGNPVLVHHLVAFVVDPDQKTESGQTNAEVMAALDQADPDRPGWSCFGAAGEGVQVLSVPVVWAPGQGVVRYPGELGVRLKPQHKLVVQMHYNLAGHAGHGPGQAAAGASDSTTLRLRHVDTIGREALFMTGDGFLETLFRNEPASLPPGQSSTKYTWSLTGQQMGMGPEFPYFDIIGVMPHMHERGVRKQMRIGPDGGPLACAANVDRWDFNWQKFYFYEGAPIRFDSNSRMEVTCEYDTSKDTQPVLPGWGTRNEMCAVIMMVALPTGM
jgi:hypothetical protein